MNGTPERKVQISVTADTDALAAALGTALARLAEMAERFAEAAKRCGATFAELDARPGAAGCATVPDGPDSPGEL